MILSCIHYKGGVGKTTTCCNLAGAAYEAGLCVLVIDLDPQGSASVYFGGSGGPSAYDWLRGETALHEVAQCSRPPADAEVGAEEEASPAEGSSAAPAPCGRIDVVRSDERLSALQAAIRQGGRLDLVAERIAGARPYLDGYHYVLVDCAPGADYLAENVLRASDVVLSTMQLAYMSVQGLLRVAATIRVAKGEGYDPRWLVLPTMYRKRRVQTRRVLESLEKQLGRYPEGYLLAPVHESVDLAYAYDARRTVFEHAPGGRGARCYADVFAQIEEVRAERERGEREPGTHTSGASPVRGSGAEDGSAPLVPPEEAGPVEASREAAASTGAPPALP